jgi:eukaryotic-like serine/threonine-protein kinase
MTLAAGSRLGPYEILAPLGAGGMGEVYRARDTRLDRTVAVKVLPERLSSSPEVRQRFEREAKTISQFSHPHICALYDVGREGETEYLVMEYLEGETLSDRLAKGALPLEQTLRYGVEMADALDKAHRQGIVHRDLKPGNVMLTKSGVKLLDFGLAKAIAPAAPQSSLTSLPTAMGSPNLTQEGTILGTFQYMAPEQLEGKEADARTDIFAFGAVLYEMATGRKAFSGASQASLISSIMKEDPAPISAIQPMTPPALDRFVKTCLAKDPEDRWQNAADIARELKWISEGSQGGAAASPLPTGFRRQAPWVVATVFVLSTLALAVLHFGGLRLFGHGEVPDRGMARFALQAPGAATSIATPVVSPDGRRIAFVAAAENRTLLWVRSLDSLVARPLAGTEGASPNAPPFWSPDGRSLAFFAGGKLKKIDASGGTSQVLAEAPVGRGGAWSPEGVILFAPETTGPILRVPAEGGTQSPATVLDGSRREFSHRFPSFLPDGRRFFYWIEAGASPEEFLAGRAVREIQVGSLETKGVLARFRPGESSVVFAPSGHLLFERQHLLFAQPFDPAALRFRGEARMVAEGILSSMSTGMPFGQPSFSISRNGVLAYRASEHSESRLTWFDRGGLRLGVVGPPGLYRTHRLSPDGTRIAATRLDAERETSDIWILDVARDSSGRFTLDPADDSMPVWSPDGSRVVFDSARKPVGIYQKLSSGATSEERLSGEKNRFPLDWSSDGRFLIYQHGFPATRGNIWVLPLSGKEARALIATPSDEVQAQFSPDGRWLAYCSDESGQYEVYVRPFSSSKGRWQVSAAGGYEPRWRRDGKEIFYLAADRRLMAVPIQAAGTTFQVGSATALFEAPLRGFLQGWENSSRYDVTADGQRFLVNVPIESAASGPLVVVLNWTAGLEK